MTWAQLKNGELLDEGEATGFDVLITADTNLRHQQNLSTRRIAIIDFPLIDFAWLFSTRRR